MEIKYILQPVLAMGMLTFIMTVWMYVVRVSAMVRLRIHPQKGQDTTKLRDLLPDKVNRVSNNYNHLFEQPTLFYILALTIAVLNLVDATFVVVAWLYVAVRIVHSMIQATVDIVMLRFYVFLTSWLLLAFILFRSCWLVFSA